MIEPLDSTGRWWRINGRDVDLNAEAGTYPPHLRAAILATRDGTEEAAADVAALAEALTSGATAPLPAAERMITQWLFEQAQHIARRALTRGTTPERNPDHVHPA